ncbi:putative sulfate exporter family transporter [Streptomyces bobili]|uniref:putative sulfate exporter family transporter n=1 Tax=Streptomyces bobili TaxID=67280 RepID=UPI0033CB0E7C
MNNLAAALAESARAHGDRIAVRQDDTVLTYAQLDGAAARVAALLRERGVRPGDRVALVMPNVTLFPVAYYGILRAGGVVVPMNPLLKCREVAHALGDSGSRIVLTAPLFAAEVTKAAAETGVECLVTDAEFGALTRAAEPMAEVVGRADGDTAVILYTSGTTGTPKGAELTHRNLSTNAVTTVETLMRIGPDDVLFAGTAVNDMSSVVAVATAYGPGAVDDAVVVKLTRTLMIIPVCLGLTLLAGRRARSAPSAPVRPAGLVPWFLVVFLLATAANSAGLVPATAHPGLKELSVFLITVALSAVGLSTDLTALRRTGPRPLLLGACLWVVVSSSSLALQYAFGGGLS